MKKLIAVVIVLVVLGVLAWTAAGPGAGMPSVPPNVSRSIGASPPVRPATGTQVTTATQQDGTGEPLDTPPADVDSIGMPGSPNARPSLEPEVPHDVIAPIATATSAPPAKAEDSVPSMRDADAPRPMIVPVAGIPRTAMRDMFDEARGGRRHEAIDILAPRGTPVIATGDGVVKKLFTSKPGGLTVYQFDPDQRFCYYYAHLDRYAVGLHEGQALRTGEILGYVGTTGNAPKDTPHLHFALIRLDADHRWWKGTYVNPYPFLSGR